MATPSIHPALDVICFDVTYALHSLQSQGFSMLSVSEAGIIASNGKYAVQFPTIEHVEDFLGKYARIRGAS